MCGGKVVFFDYAKKMCNFLKNNLKTLIHAKSSPKQTFYV